MICKIVCCFFVLSLSLVKANGLLAEYTFDGDSNSASNVDSVVDMGIWIPNEGKIRTDRVNIECIDTIGGIDPAVDTSYHSFSITVQNLGVNESLSLSSISGDYFRQNTPPNGSDHFFELYLDQDEDGFTADDKLGEARLSPPSDRETFDISTNMLNNLTNGDKLEFRVYFGDSNGHVHGYTHFLDNIQLRGEVTTVPEIKNYSLIISFILFAFFIANRSFFNF